tara:strand:- start:269 stop:724 length:456 start_codon:yes stop_codon:yes gene_type:complete
MEKILNSSTGYIKNYIHYFHRRIYFADTDAAQVVYHAEYLKLAEQARTEMLRLRGYNYNYLKRNYKAHFAIHSLSANYSKPLKLDDEIIIETNVKSLSGASIDMEQKFLLLNNKDMHLASRLNIKVVLVNDKGILIRLPKKMFKELKLLVV